MDLDAGMLDKFPLDPGKCMMEKAKVLNSPFVILHHTGHFSQDRRDHWDWLIRFPDYFLAELALRMQANQGDQFPGLLSFASQIHPNRWSVGSSFWRLAPHRNKYLEYQGEVSGQRGAVKRVAWGELEWIFLDEFQLQFRLLRLGWLDDCPPNPWFVGSSTNPSQGQYSLTLDVSSGDRTPVPWSSQAPDPGPFWRLS